MRAAALQSGLIDFTSIFRVCVPLGRVDGPITTLPSIPSAPYRGNSAQKGGACRSRSYVRNGIDRWKCRLGIIQMHAGYRPLNSAEIFCRLEIITSPDTANLFEQFSGTPAMSST
jgi:hypothetical protein